MDSQFPRSVKECIERSLGTAIHEVRLIPSGMHGRTYEIGNGFHRWVARLGMPRKAILAQQSASAAGMRTPTIVGSGRQQLERTTAYWVVEEFVAGSEFYPERFDREVAVAISTDLGRQLRMLHAVHVDGDGELGLIICRASREKEDIMLLAENVGSTGEPATEIAPFRSFGKVSYITGAVASRSCCTIQSIDGL